jgi:predicted amidophosphoribosyltransferase
VLHAFKYDGRRSLARPIAGLMAEAGAHLLADADFVVPVPLHHSRRRHRGFNQAEDLARALGPPLLCAIDRVRRTSPQVDLPAAQRHRNVRDAFALAPASLWRSMRDTRRVDRHTRLELARERLRGTRVVLVDDVCTTGATLAACARVLKEAGVEEVRGLTAARAAWRPDP